MFLPALTPFVFFSLLAAVEVRAQIVVDTVSTGTQTVNGAAGAFTFSFSHTTTAGGTNGLLVVGVSMNATANTNSTITGITYGVQTLTKTLASKYRIAVPKVYKKYQATFQEDKKRYKVLQVVIEREGKGDGADCRRAGRGRVQQEDGSAEGPAGDLWH